MQLKLCIIVSDVDTSHLIETMGRSLNREKYEVSFVFLGRTVPSLFHTLLGHGHVVKFVKCDGKKELLPAVIRIGKILDEIKPDIVHTHLVNASIAGLTAAKLKGIKQRIHTRHHSVETHFDYPHGVYYDRLINYLSTHIVAISEVVSDVLIQRENVNPKKISVIRHGFDLDRFKAVESLVDEIKDKYELNAHYPVIGVISRHIHWKGVQFIIPAFKEVVKKYPKAKLVLANALGPYHAQINQLLNSLDESQYVLIEFEKRIFELYETFDVFVHAPIGKEYEAFGQVYVEALMMGVPSVFTLSGIANDFIKDKYNALAVPYGDSQAIYQAIELLLTDADLRRNIAAHGKSSILGLFQERQMADALDRLYDQNKIVA
ncbi:MAG: glycosyltransferase family 4 protein [Pyrinomonadaceae bacterium]